MRPYYSDGQATLYQGDCRDVLRELEAASVQCVVTSPPYWAQRDYGLGEWVGGDAECEHAGLPIRTLAGCNERYHGKKFATDKQGETPGPSCRCGAVRQSEGIGLEPTPQAWIAAMVDVMREVWRVLRDDGTVWLNLGDKYAGSGGAGGDYNEGGLKANAAGTGPAGSPVRYSHHRDSDNNRPPRKSQDGYQAKDLMLLPHRLAIALQDDGWIVRQDIIWAKPAPMPESCTDRPTRAHEYVFLLSKQGRYFYDADAVREAMTESSIARISQPTFASQKGGAKDYGHGTNPNRSARKALENLAAHSDGGRNLRSVWTMNTQPFPGAHYAVFPEELPRKCILAGTSEKGCCPECGAPWERVVETTQEFISEHPGGERRGDARRNPGTRTDTPTVITRRIDKTTGWRPTCDHDAEPVPSVALDPFAGTGTMLKVAKALGRHAVGIELSADYCEMAVKRLPQMAMALNSTISGKR